ncbi:MULTISPECIES: hypothetical protein [Burkholderia cepacia complex]|uniref:hypothetical protein n=1 Tax=Burkholderia cepacia complex TaxID=87882 RepID=UPI00018E38D3|nr:MULTISPECIES: hypothetical protein [Burkholderia cepacia complex]EED97274.1 hypothetical protein BURMUCGD1_6603 [Burkholderia multivorans CGD1]MDN7610690.1 hypothetical protein [Burkholderia multivorans]
MTKTIPDGTYTLETGNGAQVWATVVGNTLKIFDEFPTEPISGKLRVQNPTFSPSPDETTSHRLAGNRLRFVDANGVERTFDVTVVEFA